MALALKILRDTYKAHYAGLYIPGDDENDSGTESVVERTSSSKTASLNVYDNLPSLTTFKNTAPTDELERYLREDIENIRIEDALKWWAGKQHVYPRLSRMAMDYLSIPGKSLVAVVCHHRAHLILATSVDVERVFSRGRLILSHTRSRLSAQTSRAIICLGCWSTLDMAKSATLARVFKNVREAELGEVETLFEDGWDL
jgi:hypothetical protein